jgi:hypothetical protein
MKGNLQQNRNYGGLHKWRKWNGRSLHNSVNAANKNQYLPGRPKNKNRLPILSRFLPECAANVQQLAENFRGWDMGANCRSLTMKLLPDN